MALGKNRAQVRSRGRVATGGLGVLAPAVTIAALSRWVPGITSLAAVHEGDSEQGQEPTLDPTVSVVIPTLNEGASIGWVLERLPPRVSEVVLVDGLSTDLTEAVARSVRPDAVVVHQRARGKGAALRAGMAAARSEVIVMMDADGSHDPGEIPRFIEALVAGADFVKGSRCISGGGSLDLTTLRSSGNRGLVALTNVVYGSRFTDLCYGYCAFWRRHLGALALTAEGFEIETQLVLSAVRAGLRIREVPSLELARREGRSHLNTFRDGRRVLGAILAGRGARRSHPPGYPTGVVLQHVEAFPMDCESWLPAGCDRRRGERRWPVAADGRTLEPDRRRRERRRQPRPSASVYLAANAGGFESAPVYGAAARPAWRSRSGTSSPAVRASPAREGSSTASSTPEGLSSSAARASRARKGSPTATPAPNGTRRTSDKGRLRARPGP